MSDCRVPMSRPEGVHGTVYWSDGTTSGLMFARNVNGKERHVLRAVIDGVLLAPTKPHEDSGVYD